MKRPIKFRAWNTLAKAFDTGWIYPAIVSNHTFEAGIPDGVVLMQFTGLFAAQEKEIYEGDILVPKRVAKYPHAFDGKTPWAVTWNDHLMCFELTDGNLSIGILDSETSALFKIVGNIWENPDLLSSIMAEWTPSRPTVKKTRKT